MLRWVKDRLRRLWALLGAWCKKEIFITGDWLGHRPWTAVLLGAIAAVLISWAASLLAQAPVQEPIPVTTQSNFVQILMAIGSLITVLVMAYNTIVQKKVKADVSEVKTQTLAQGQVQLIQTEKLAVIQASVDESTVEKVRASVFAHFDQRLEEHLKPIREAIAKNKASADETKADLREVKE